MASCRVVMGTWSVLLLFCGCTCGMKMMQVADRGEVLSGTSGYQPVALMWGIADTTATVGRLFQYHIPSDAFKGSVDKYVVLEAGKDTLPKWLHFDDEQSVIRGYPAPSDAGQLYLEVFAHGKDGSTAMDVFSVIVNPDSPSLSSSQPLTFRKSGLDVVRCKRDEPETVATIIVDVDMEVLAADKQVALVDRFLSHMGLGEGVVKVTSVAGNMEDASALVTGVGDTKDPQTPGVSLSWLVGCGKVDAGQFAILQKLDDDSSSGQMAKAVGHPIIGWRVTNTRLQQQHAVKRRRRQVHATPTPVITISPPTSTGSVVDTGTSDTDTMTHKIVHMTSPTFTIEPAPTVPEMPKTAIPAEPPVSTPKMVKPDAIQPSETPALPVEVSKTEILPTDMATRVPPTTTTTTTTRATTRTPKPTTPKPTTTTTKKTTTTMAMECLKPDVNEEISRVNVYVGEILEYPIPEETFTACGRGGTSSLKLTMLLNTSSRIPEDYWMQFDREAQVLRALPMEKDIGRHSVTLVAKLPDQEFIVNTPFKVHVRQPGKKNAINHEVSMTFDADYATFNRNLDSKLDLARRVASVYGEDNVSSMTVTRIAPGSVVYAWSNKTLAGTDCPVEDIRSVGSKIIHDDGTLTEEAIEKLRPWKLVGASLAPLGECQYDPAFPVLSATLRPVTARPEQFPDMTTAYKPMMSTSSAATPEIVKPDKTMAPTSPPMPAPNTTESVAKGSTTSTDDIWITTVVPAVVIVSILVLALLIACILYRKKRKGKMNLEDQNTFVNKGAPVIFPDELDDKPSDSTKPLLLETPPAPPPEYHRGTSESPERRTGLKETTPPTDEADPDIEETSVTSPLYQPPPPVTSSSGKQARPHVQQPYKSQPPKIQP